MDYLAFFIPTEVIALFVDQHPANIVCATGPPILVYEDADDHGVIHGGSGVVFGVDRGD